jgi:hypothetical protein
LAKGIVYESKKWFAVPAVFSKYFELAGPERDILIALYLQGRGFKKNLKLTNDRLMNLSGITRQQTFTTARRNLMKTHGLIRFYKTDGLGRMFEYELLDTALSAEERERADEKVNPAHLSMDDAVAAEAGDGGMDDVPMDEIFAKPPHRVAASAGKPATVAVG